MEDMQLTMREMLIWTLAFSDLGHTGELESVWTVNRAAGTVPAKGAGSLDHLP